MSEETTSRKKIIIIGIILLIIFAIIGYFFITRLRNQSSDGLPSRDLFPFGSGTTDQPVAPVETPDESIPTGENPLAINESERLRMITNYPVTDFFPFITQRTITQNKLDEATGESSPVTTTFPLNIIRYNAARNGIVLDAEVTHDSIVITQKTTDEIQKTEEAWFADGGFSIIFRSWNETSREINSFLGTIPRLIPLDYCDVPFTKELKPGIKNPEVLALQNYLLKKEDTVVTLDGSFGPKMTELVKKLQLKLGITETGIVDAETREALNTSCQNIHKVQTESLEKPIAMKGVFLQNKILRGTTSPDSNSLFFLRPTSGGVTGTITTANGSNPRTIFNSASTEWMPQWFNSETIAMTSLAANQADGYLYFLTTTSDIFKKILGPIKGLTTLTNPTGEFVLFNQSKENSFVTLVYNTQTGAMAALPLTTLPQKCVWYTRTIFYCAVPKSIPSTQYPDAWYQGIVSFSDALWEINIEKGTTNILIDPSQSFDIDKIRVSPDGSYLYFRNKKDGYLWSYRITD